MRDIITEYLSKNIEPFNDYLYGRGFRCSVYLQDDTYLPCVILRETTKIVELALKRLAETKQDKRVVKNSNIDDPYKDIVKHFVTSGNQVSECDIKNITESKYAFPMRLLAELECETTMSWTGFVLEMNDGKLFQYGTTWLVEFFELPKNYSFNDVAKLHNHSYINSQGELQSLSHGFSKLPQDYELSKLYREKPYFVCYTDIY